VVKIDASSYRGWLSGNIPVWCSAFLLCAIPDSMGAHFIACIAGQKKKSHRLVNHLNTGAGCRTWTRRSWSRPGGGAKWGQDWAQYRTLLTHDNFLLMLAVWIKSRIIDSARRMPLQVKCANLSTASPVFRS